MGFDKILAVWIIGKVLLKMHWAGWSKPKRGDQHGGRGIICWMKDNLSAN